MSVDIVYVRQALATTRGWLAQGRPPEGLYALNAALDLIEQNSEAADLRDRYGDKLDGWCIVCGVESGQPCKVINGPRHDGLSAGDERPYPHFYRGTEGRAAA